MFAPENKITAAVSAIIPPFALAAVILLAILSFVEYFRRGFVSLFLDLRIVLVVAMVLWAGACLLTPPRKSSWFSLAGTGILLAAFLPILWRLTVPYGRLGLLAFGAGVSSAVIIFIASITPQPITNNQ
jgi:hypothetical protein